MLFGIVHTWASLWRWCHSLTFIGCPARASFIPPRVCNLAHLAFASSDYWHYHKDFSDFLSIFVKLHFLPRFCTLPHTRLDGDNDSIEWSVFAPSVFSRWIQAWIFSCVLSASKICTFIASSSGSSPMSADSLSPFYKKVQFGLLEKILRVVEHCKDLSLAALSRLCLVVHLVFHIELSLFSHF